MWLHSEYCYCREVLFVCMAFESVDDKGCLLAGHPVKFGCAVADVRRVKCRKYSEVVCGCYA